MLRKLVLVLIVSMVVAPAFGEWYYRGQENGWGATLMADNLDGTYEITLSGSPAAYTEWKFAQTADGWDWPAANSWGYFDGDGNLTITLDTNSYSDGWLNTTNRIGLSIDTVDTWQAVGDFNGWSNADSAWDMTPLGGGIYQVQGTIAAPGTYAYKAIESGTWNAIGADARSVDASNISFETTVANETVKFQVNALDGTARVIPEPVTLGLLGLGGLALVRRRVRG